MPYADDAMETQNVRDRPHVHVIKKDAMYRLPKIQSLWSRHVQEGKRPANFSCIWEQRPVFSSSRDILAHGCLDKGGI